MKTFESIIFIIIFIVFTITAFWYLTGLCIDYLSGVKEIRKDIPCYDKDNHEIKELTCVKTTYCSYNPSEFWRMLPKCEVMK